jgi:hypothetical protein
VGRRPGLGSRGTQQQQQRYEAEATGDDDAHTASLAATRVAPDSTPAYDAFRGVDAPTS